MNTEGCSLDIFIPFHIVSDIFIKLIDKNSITIIVIIQIIKYSLTTLIYAQGFPLKHTSAYNSLYFLVYFLL